MSPWSTTPVASIRRRCTPWRRSSPSRSRDDVGGAAWGGERPLGQAKGAVARGGLDLPPGMPSHEPCGRVLAVLDPARLRRPWSPGGRPSPTGARPSSPARGKPSGGPWTGRMVKARCTSSLPGPQPMSWCERRSQVTPPPPRHRPPCVAPPAPSGRRRGDHRGDGGSGGIARQRQAPGADAVLRVPAQQPGVDRAGDDLCLWLRGSPPALNPSRVATLHRSLAATGGERRVGCGAPTRLRA